MYELTVYERSQMPVRALSKNSSGVIFDPNANEYLLHFRDNKTLYYPETWAPFGGGSEGRETPRQTLIRELREELLLEVEPHVLLPRGKRAKSGGEFSHYFLVVIDRTQHELVLQEGSDMAWFTPADLHQLIVETKAVTPGLTYLHDKGTLLVPEYELKRYQRLIGR